MRSASATPNRFIVIETKTVEIKRGASLVRQLCYVKTISTRSRSPPLTFYKEVPALNGKFSAGCRQGGERRIWSAT